MWQRLLLLFFVFCLLFRTDQSFDQDLGRHIKLGEIIWQTKAVPKVNLFSYTHPDFPFINTHWLFGVLAYLFWEAQLLQFLLVLKVIIFLISTFLIFKLIPKQNSVLLLPIGFIFLHVLRERLELRPEIFSFLFTTITLFILDKFLKQKTKWIFILPFIQLIWINTHIYFFVGLILQLIFLTHIFYEYLRFKLLETQLKLLSVVFILSVIVSLINPNGITGLLYPLNVNKNYGYTIVENQTMFFLESINFKNPNFLYTKISIGIIIVSLIFTFIRRNFILKNILLSLMGIVLALINVRSFPYLVFISFPFIIQNFGPIRSNSLAKVINFIFIFILLFESFNYLTGRYYKTQDSSYEVGLELEENVKGALDFTLANDLPNPIFNNFDIGSYIIYRGYPKYKVFVDGRPEGYPKEFFQNLYIPMQYDYTRFKTEEKNFGFKTIIFSHTDQTPWGKNFLQNIIKDKDFKLVYFDDFMVVLVKSEIAKNKNLKEVDLSNLSPSNYPFTNYISYLRMGIFLMNTQNNTSGTKFIYKAKQLNPQSSILNSF